MEIFVYKNEIAIELVDMGYHIVRLEKHNKQPNKTVFFFKNENNIVDEIKRLKHKYWED